MGKWRERKGGERERGKGERGRERELEFEWGCYALSASKVIFRALQYSHTYTYNLFRPVMMIS